MFTIETGDRLIFPPKLYDVTVFRGRSQKTVQNACYRGTVDRYRSHDHTFFWVDMSPGTIVYAKEDDNPAWMDMDNTEAKNGMSPSELHV